MQEMPLGRPGRLPRGGPRGEIPPLQGVPLLLLVADRAVPAGPEGRLPPGLLPVPPGGGKGRGGPEGMHGDVPRAEEIRGYGAPVRGGPRRTTIPAQGGVSCQNPRFG